MGVILPQYPNQASGLSRFVPPEPALSCSPVISLCPRCGSEFPELVLGELIQTAVICPGCRLAPVDVPPMLGPADDELAYEMDDWPIVDRAVFTDALAREEIPYRWEPGLALIVPPEMEERVDALIENFDSLLPSTLEEAAEEEGDGGEEAYQLMNDLFLVADRLMHSPYDQKIGLEFRKLGPVVENTLPPFGVEPAVWRKVKALTASVSGLVEDDAEGDVITDEVTALRGLLRDLI